MFNPVEIQLKENVLEQFNNLMYWYREIESDTSLKPHIARLLTHPNLLLEQNISAWEQDVIPTFEDDKVLSESAKYRNRTIEKFRRGFTTDFTDAMKDIVRRDAKDFEIALPEIPELDDIVTELEELEADIEREIQENKHLEDEERNE